MTRQTPHFLWTKENVNLNLISLSTNLSIQTKLFAKMDLLQISRELTSQGVCNNVVGRPKSMSLGCLTRFLHVLKNRYLWVMINSFSVLIAGNRYIKAYNVIRKAINCLSILLVVWSIIKKCRFKSRKDTYWGILRTEVLGYFNFVIYAITMHDLVKSMFSGLTKTQQHKVLVLEKQVSELVKKKTGLDFGQVFYWSAVGVLLVVGLTNPKVVKKAISEVVTEPKKSGSSVSSRDLSIFERDFWFGDELEKRLKQEGRPYQAGPGTMTPRSAIIVERLLPYIFTSMVGFLIGDSLSAGQAVQNGLGIGRPVIAVSNNAPSIWDVSTLNLPSPSSILPRLPSFPMRFPSFGSVASSLESAGAELANFAELASFFPSSPT
jgi:hypothetical protein